MRVFVLGSVLLWASVCSGSHHAVSSQYQAHDGIGGYSYGYSDPNSQKHESKDAHGVTHGGYSYIDGSGHLQTVKYTADPIHGFQVAATNLPKGPAPAVISVPAHYAGPWAYSHHAAIGYNGAPLETPEVQAAKAKHFAAHAEANARLHKRSLYAAPWGYVPADTPEVAAAKAAHLAAHAAAKAGHYGPAPVNHWDHQAPAHKVWYGPIHIPVIHKGVPVETPEVQHAKAAHAAAHAKLHGYAPIHDYHQGHAYGAWHGPQHIPVIKGGVPVETPEVQHAKVAHAAAHAEVHGYAPIHDYHQSHTYGAWHGPQHVPVIKGGVPVETPEVQHAKAAHLNALALASAHSGPHGHEDDGSYKPQWDHKNYQ
ncbi:pupal cuticle protein-like [Toxorhynchites rutilus septentrionalis]|uniref:pupal cuticle protein-like n=1 Tax=Toxorhynchites rutilus septentrionalis TaxID=329112 RepID=UPI0024784D37|nr:pupal cuticle protein-like [Toxorhynchites rutilus septentrionalis]